MISVTKARLAPLFRRNRRVRRQKNAHFLGMGWGWSLNLRIQVKGLVMGLIIGARMR